jgi:Domain of Unknown Function (DUF1080)
MSSNYPPFGNAAALRCQRCGNPLPLNEVYCGNCGFNNMQQAQQAMQSPSGPSWGSAAPPYGSGQFGGQQWGQPPVQYPPNSPFSGPPLAPQQPFGMPPGQEPSPNNPFTQQQPFGNIPSSPSGPNNYYGGAAPQQTFPTQLYQQPITGGYNGSSYQAAGFPQTRPQPPMMNGFPPGGDYAGEQMDESSGQRRGPRVGRIIGVILLILVLVGAGLGGYFYFKHGGTTVQATPTPIPPTVTPTGKALFSDTFINNNNGWDTSSKAGEYVVKVGNGVMTLEDDNNRLLWELVPGTSRNFGNFYLTVDATLSKGTKNNGYGIYIRGASSSALDIATYYRFELYGDGTYAIFKGSVDASGVSSSTALVTYTMTPVIQKQGQVNHIAINAQGAVMTFWVNGVKLKAVTDNTYAGGSVALFISNLTSTTAGAQATFSKFAIYPPQVQ